MLLFCFLIIRLEMLLKIIRTVAVLIFTYFVFILRIFFS